MYKSAVKLVDIYILLFSSAVDLLVYFKYITFSYSVKEFSKYAKLNNNIILCSGVQLTELLFL